MATKVMTARAVIEAQDRTGGIFSGIAAKVRAMSSAFREADGAGARLGRSSARVGAQVGATSRQIGALSGTVQRQAAAQSRVLDGASAGLAATRAAGIGAVARIAAPAAAVYGVARSIKEYASLEAAVADAGITANATDAQIKEARDRLQQIAPALGRSATDAAKPLGQLTAAGLSFNEALTATPAVLRTAVAANAELSDTATAGIAAMKQYGIAGKDLERAFDIAHYGGKQGQFEFKDMAGHLASMGANAKRMRLDGDKGLATTVASLQVLREATGSGAEAATRFENVTGKAFIQETSKKFKEMGKDLEKEFKAGAEKGVDHLTTLVRLTKEVTGGDQFKMAKLFGDKEALEGVNALVQGWDRVVSLRDEALGKAGGTVARDLDRRLSLTQSKLARFSAQSTVTMQRVGEAAAGSLLPVVEALNRGLERLQVAASGKGAEAFREHPLYEQAKTAEAAISKVQQSADRYSATLKAQRELAGELAGGSPDDRQLVEEQKAKLQELRLLEKRRDLATLEGNYTGKSFAGGDGAPILPGRARERAGQLREEIAALEGSVTGAARLNSNFDLLTDTMSGATAAAQAMVAGLRMAQKPSKTPETTPGLRSFGITGAPKQPEAAWDTPSFGPAIPKDWTDPSKQKGGKAAPRPKGDPLWRLSDVLDMDKPGAAHRPLAYSGPSTLPETPVVAGASRPFGRFTNRLSQDGGVRPAAPPYRADGTQPSIGGAITGGAASMAPLNDAAGALREAAAAFTGKLEGLSVASRDAAAQTAAPVAAPSPLPIPNPLPVSIPAGFGLGGPLPAAAAAPPIPNPLPVTFPRDFSPAAPAALPPPSIPNPLPVSFPSGFNLGGPAAPPDTSGLNDAIGRLSAAIPSGPLDAKLVPDQIIARVQEPIPVKDPVLQGSASVSVKVSPTSALLSAVASITAQGHLSAGNTGVSMPHVGGE